MIMYNELTGPARTSVPNPSFRDARPPHNGWVVAEGRSNCCFCFAETHRRRSSTASAVDSGPSACARASETDKRQSLRLRLPACASSPTVTEAPRIL